MWPWSLDVSTDSYLLKNRTAFSLRNRNSVSKTAQSAAGFPLFIQNIQRLEKAIPLRSLADRTSCQSQLLTEELFCSFGLISPSVRIK